jgi:hypothetical protein
MSEKQKMREHIFDGGDIVEVCENADIEALRREGEVELAAAVEVMCSVHDTVTNLLGLYEVDF